MGFIWLRSEISCYQRWHGTNGEPPLAYGLLEQDRIVTRDVLQVVTQGLAQEKNQIRSRGSKNRRMRGP